MATALTTTARGWQRIGRVVQEVEGAPLQAIRRQRRWPIGAAPPNSKPYRVTTVNCILDGFDLATLPGTIVLDPGERPYVMCKPVDDIVLGTVPDGAEERKLYCDLLTPGFVAYGLLLFAKVVDGKLTARTALASAWSKFVSADGDVLTLNIFADQSNTDFYVEAESTVKCSGAVGAPSTVDQLVKVEWEQYPAGSTFGAGLFSREWCCPS